MFDPNCPGCNKPYKPPIEQCSLNKPLWMVIPPEGVHLSCPIHPQGHHVFGSRISYSITVWKDGGYRAWRNTDAYYAEGDSDWLTTIPITLEI